MKKPHIHHWLLESPHGTEYVHAKCKLCKAKRDYLTALPIEMDLFLARTVPLNKPAMVFRRVLSH